MGEDTLKLKKGGLDTIVAYIVVMLPLLYVLIYMVATIYHFSVQTYMNQVVKEATVMASTYGELTSAHENYINSKLKGILKNKADPEKAAINIEYYIRRFDETSGTVNGIEPYLLIYNNNELKRAKKADIIGIKVTSTENSILDAVTSFGIFGSNDNYSGGLKYTSYREEIIRNERKYNP